MNAMNELSRALRAAEEDNHGGKVMISIEVAKQLLSEGQSIAKRQRQVYPFSPLDPKGSR